MDDNDSLRESELKLARKGQQLRSIAATTIIITTKLAPWTSLPAKRNSIIMGMLRSVSP
jgi:hypothetical protein